MGVKEAAARLVPAKLMKAYSLCKTNVLIAKKHREIQKNWKNRPIKNDKMRIVFIVQRTEVFNSVRTVFEAAAASGQCEVYLLPIPRNALGSGLEWDTYAAVIDFCKNLGSGTVLDAYDPEKKQFRDLRTIHPDYIFLNTPYTDAYPEPYFIENLSKIAKVCYVPYGYSMMEKHLEYIYRDRSFTENVSYIFSSSKLEYGFAKKYFLLSHLINGISLYNIGFPRFDLVKKNSPERKTVLWLPRWTAEIQKGNGQSSFLCMKDDFLRFAIEKPELFIVIRPHPLMFLNYQKNGIMTENEIRQFIQAVEDIPNVVLDLSEDYMDALNEAWVLVSDFSSLLAEFYVSGKPIIYTGEVEDFSPYERDMLATFYVENAWSGIKRMLCQLHSGDDPHAADRSKSVNKFLVNKEQGIGKSIFARLKDDYQKNIKRQKTE